jgi:hypothetical protein
VFALHLLSFGRFKFCGPLDEFFVNPFEVLKSLLAVKAQEEVLFEAVRLRSRKGSVEVVVQLLARPWLNAGKPCL